MHNKTLPKAKGFQCENCNETFFNPEYWIIHREKCGVDKNHARIPCALCNKRYSRKDRLKYHMVMHHGAGSFEEHYRGEVYQSEKRNVEIRSFLGSPKFFLKFFFSKIFSYFSFPL